MERIRAATFGYGNKSYKATYKDYSYDGVTELDAILGAINESGDILSIRYAPHDMRMLAVCELQYASQDDAALAEAQYARVPQDQRLYNPNTLAQELSMSDNKFMAGYEERLYNAALKKLAGKYKVAKIEVATKAAENK